MAWKECGVAVAQTGCGAVQTGCGVTQTGGGAAHIKFGVAQLGCGVQMVGRRHAEWQARVRTTTRHTSGGPSSSTKRNQSEDIQSLSECDECMDE